MKGYNRLVTHHATHHAAPVSAAAAIATVEPVRYGNAIDRLARTVAAFEATADMLGAEGAL